MKRKWSNTAGLVDLGLSRSALRTLDSVESAMEGVERASAAIRGAGLGKAGAGLSGVLSGMDGIRVGGASGTAAVSPAAAFPDVRANADAALGRLGVDLAGGLKGILGSRFEDIAGVASAKNLALGKASRAYPAFGGLPDPFKGASSLSSAFKAADLVGAIPRKSTALGFSTKMLGASADLSAPRSAVSFLGAEKKADGIIASAWKPGWKDALLSGWKSDLLSGASSGPSGWLGIADAVKNSGAWRNAMGLSDTDWLYGPPRGLGLFGKPGAADILRGALPVFDALDAAGRGLGGLLDAVGRIDFDALRRTADREARVWEARRPRTGIGFAALKAYDAFYLGQPWVADAFLKEHLGIEPNEDRREALWLVLRWTFERTVPRPAKWLVIDDEGAVRYLRAAVHKNAKRVRRDKERPDRVWWEERDPEKKKVELPPPTRQPDDILELMMRRSGNPAEILVPPPDDRGRVLEMLYFKGTEQDRKVVSMLIAGFDLAAIAGVVGCPEVQRFTRKAQRWRKNRLDPSSGG
jgi:hypothetical protein